MHWPYNLSLQKVSDAVVLYYTIGIETNELIFRVKFGFLMIKFVVTVAKWQENL